jgi:SAM-dependent methyltransferase
MAEADEGLLARTKAMWAGGDYVRVAERLQPAADVLVAAAGVAPGERVLDVAAGTGNVAAAAAAAGAEVTASDLSPAMVELGRERTRGLAVEWVEADAQDLPFPDGAFDRTLSAFGAMFAPDPERTAAELVRVTRRGGVVGMANWIPEGAPAAVTELFVRRLPQAPSAMAEHWGDPERVRAFFGPEVALRTERRALRWTYPDAEAWWDYMQSGPPPIVAARAAIGEPEWARVREEALAIAAAIGPAPEGGFAFEPPYLVVLARR